MPLLLVRNDITKMDTDAIVLPANPYLEEGSGTSRGIYLAAGEEKLTGELKFRYPHGCEMGRAVITGGYDLKAKHIIHAVCPQWLGGHMNEADHLYSAYRSALNLAKAENLDSISFPLLSTGNYEYPKAEALNIANHAITDFLQDNEMDVFLVFYGEEALREGSRLYGHIESFIDDTYVEYNDEDFIVEFRRDIEFSSYSVSQECLYPDMSDDILPDDVENFHDMLLRLIDESGKKPSAVYKAGNISKQTFSKIKNNPDMIPTKRTIIGFALGLELSLEETKELLEVAGYALSKATKFDVIVTCFLRDRNYDCMALNEFLFDHGLENELIGY